MLLQLILSRSYEDPANARWLNALQTGLSLIIVFIPLLLLAAYLMLEPTP